MPPIVTALLLAAASGQTGAAVSDIPPRPVAGETAIEGNGGTRSVNCAGGTLAIRGNGNNVSAAGCARIGIEGNGNIVQARFDRFGRLDVRGNNNHLAWSGPGGARMAVVDSGTGNTIVRR